MDQRTVRPRIDDVAREAGVSKTAVSFAFNSPERLAPETADRILAVAEQLGYSPHPVARMLTQGATLTIGVLTPQPLSVVFANPFFGTFAAGVGAAAEKAGYALQFISPAAWLAGRRDASRHRRRRGRRRAVGRPPGGRRDPADRRSGRAGRLGRGRGLELDRGRRRGRGARGGRAPPRARSSRRAGHRGGAAGAGLVAAGRRPASGVTARRLAGYREALRAAGVELGDERVVDGPATIDGGRPRSSGPGRPAFDRPASSR